MASNDLTNTVLDLFSASFMAAPSLLEHVHTPEPMTSSTS